MEKSIGFISEVTGTVSSKADKMKKMADDFLQERLKSEGATLFEVKKNRSHLQKSSGFWDIESLSHSLRLLLFLQLGRLRSGLSFSLVDGNFCGPENGKLYANDHTSGSRNRDKTSWDLETFPNHQSVGFSMDVSRTCCCMKSKPGFSCK